MTQVSEIYVALIDEGVDVWRPVKAERIKKSLFRILDQPYNREIELWQFGPGDLVICELMESSDGPIMAATKKVE